MAHRLGPTSQISLPPSGSLGMNLREGQARSRMPLSLGVLGL